MYLWAMSKTTIEDKRKVSAALFQEALKYFPGGVHSPVRAFKSVAGPPLFIKEGKGCRITDEDDHVYIDFCCSWGPLILGHNHKAVKNAIIATAANGTSFGAPTRLGNEMGKLLVDHHRFIEKIRFVSSGTEAVMSAIRLARGATGRNKVVKFEGCYHGHVDSLLVRAGSGLATFGESTSAGIPDGFIRETIVLPLNDTEAMDRALQQYAFEIACIIIEPIPANNGLLLQPRSFLQYLREQCTRHGILLIFDEVISGFRIGFEGAAAYYDIAPDLLTFGKIIGGGMPVGAYAGGASIMSHVAPEGPVYQAGTLSANPVAMAAGYAALKQLMAPGFYDELAGRTARFVARILAFAKKKGFPLSIPHIGSIFWFSFSSDVLTRADQIDPAGMDLFKEFHAGLLQQGVYLGPSGYEVGFVSAAHGEEDLEEAAGIICGVLEEVIC